MIIGGGFWVVGFLVGSSYDPAKNLSQFAFRKNI